MTMSKYNISDFHGAVSGTQVQLIFTPSAEAGGEWSVCNWANVGAGEPMDVYHRRALRLCSVPVETVAEFLEEWCREREQIWDELDACYLGSEWNGHNHVGRWSDLQWLDAKMDSIDRDFAMYMDASDWLYADLPQAKRQILECESLDSLADDLISEAEPNIIERTNMESELRHIAQRMLDDLDPAEDLESIAKLRQLLGSANIGLWSGVNHESWREQFIDHLDDENERQRWGELLADNVFDKLVELGLRPFHALQQSRGAMVICQTQNADDLVNEIIDRFKDEILAELQTD
jgi:hypothetical protein